MGSTRLNGVMTYYFVGFGVTGWGLPFRTSGAALEPYGHGGMLRLCGAVSKNIPPLVVLIQILSTPAPPPPSS